MDSTFLNVTNVEGNVKSCDVPNHSAAMRLVRSRYALRGRKELKSELGGEGHSGERKEGREGERGYGLMPFGSIAFRITDQLLAVVALNRGRSIYG